MKRTAITALLLTILLALVAGVQHNFKGVSGTIKVSAATDELVNQGTGLYTDASVASQVSTFSINPSGVTCGVGTVDANGNAGPFEMLMFSVGTITYVVDPVQRTITASGKMRSITRVGGVVVEDVIHDFTSVAVDNQPSRPQPNRADRFETHFATPFWNTSNPLCTASPRVPGGCRFGGQLMLGDINVSAS